MSTAAALMIPDRVIGNSPAYIEQPKALFGTICAFTCNVGIRFSLHEIDIFQGYSISH
jgi:hypothetical protein